MIEARIAERIVPQESGCWGWTGAIHHLGYSLVSVNRRPRQAHRVIYEMLNGPVPEGLELDHLCRNRWCVNPAHLEPVTHRENVFRSPIAVAAINARKTHCLRGHPFDEANTYRTPIGGRACRACRNARERAERAERRAGLASVAP